MARIIFLLGVIFFMNIDATESFPFTKEQVDAYHNKTQGAVAQNPLAILGPDFFVGAHRILDVGCGDGKITALLAEQMPHSSVIGCDASPSMIEFALKQYGSKEYPNLKFVEKNACEMGFQEEFDRVISFNCLHWISDQKLAIRKIYNSLKTGGKALLVACPRSAEDDLQAICGKLVATPKWRSYFEKVRSVHSFHTEQEYRQLMSEAGFIIDKIEGGIREVPFENQQAFIGWVTPVLTPLHYLQEEKRSAFIQDLCSELKLKGRIDAEGKVHLHIGQIQILVGKSADKL